MYLMFFDKAVEDELKRSKKKNHSIKNKKTLVGAKVENLFF